MRASGVLLPIASLPSKYGIGTFSKYAYQFVDQLKEAGQKYWQILPLGPTGYGDSPYQSFSTFAGNPYLIDLETLIEEGYLTERECDAYDFGEDEREIDYEKLYHARFQVLRKAFQNKQLMDSEDYNQFLADNSFWVEEYALFMAVKNHFGGVSWSEWEDEIRIRDEKALEYYRVLLKEEVEFFLFQQYHFFKQWRDLKHYANNKGIKIIGDIPIYVAFDSSDCWGNPELFQLDQDKKPVAVAGCPPDAFSCTGQLWGNPLYDWEYHKKTGYAWWEKRIAYCFKIYDVVRVDHFRGFDEYYSIPFGAKTAEFGKWEKGPGFEIFQRLGQKLGKMNIIAEDLGFLTEGVLKLVRDTGYPGMKILQFAFDSREESDYLPHNYSKNCVVYTGTHDNDTLMGWYQTICKEDKQFAINYLNNADTVPEEIPWDYIRLAMASVAQLCIIPIQDYLCLGSEARINIPSTLGNNWKWRMLDGEVTKELKKRIFELTKLYGRL